jgi:hypothetical protein
MHKKRMKLTTRKTRVYDYCHNGNNILIHTACLKGEPGGIPDHPNCMPWANAGGFFP